MDHHSKTHIAKAIKYEMDKKSLSLRSFAERIQGMSYPQIHRITAEQNYNIDTLLKVLDKLELEIVVKKKY